MATTHSLVLFTAMTPQQAHQPPPVPFTIAQAHTVMQFHIACRVVRCPRKAAAQDTLIEVGHMVPSTTKPR